MAVALEHKRRWTADEFVATDQGVFGPLWRYELIDGEVVGHAAPAPEHGAIIVRLGAAVLRALDDSQTSCRAEAGSAATPRTQQRNTARIPDLLIRCGEHPRVAFEVVSPSEIRDWRARDRKRTDLQSVPGMQEIVELFQDDYACHVYRRAETPEGIIWTFEALGGANAVLHLRSVGIEFTLAEIYSSVLPVPEQQA